MSDVRGWQRKRTHWALFLALVRSLSPAATNSLAALIQHNHIDFPVDSNLMFRASQPPTLSWLTCAQTAEPGCWIIQSEIFLFPVTSFIRRRLWRPTPSLGPLCVVCSVLQSSAQWENVGAQPEMWVIASLGWPCPTPKKAVWLPNIYLSFRIWEELGDKLIFWCTWVLLLLEKYGMFVSMKLVIVNGLGLGQRKAGCWH